MMWKFDKDLMILFNHIQYIAKSCGYILSLYGSVITKGYSEKDLDVVAHHIIEKKYANKDRLISGLLGVFKGELVSSYKSELLETEAIIIKTKNNQLIDLKILDINERSFRYETNKI